MVQTLGDREESSNLHRRWTDRKSVRRHHDDGYA
jgi:hypothetical protein